MKPTPARSWFLALSTMVAIAVAARADVSTQPVRITRKPTGLVTGALQLPVVATAPVERLALFVNGVPHGVAAGRTITAELEVGLYLRRLRLRAVGYDAAGNVVGADEATINDPRPPFRVRLQGPPAWPASGNAELHASVIGPAELRLTGVDFFVGEERVATDSAAPYGAVVEGARFPGAVYARAVARAGGQEANDVVFFGEPAHAAAEVTLQQVPVSVVGVVNAPLRAESIALWDAGERREIDGLLPAADEPLHVILLIDYSESMLVELPVVRAAARQFARELLRPQDRLAVVGFNERTFWLTGWTNDWNAAALAIDRTQPSGETHLYDSVIAMLYALQTTPGRHALVVLTDGADQGSRFELDHLVHYARYAGVPIYPVIKNRTLQRWMRVGVGRLQARRVARIAEDTGATWFLIQRESELAPVYARIARELRQQYQIVFHSEAAMPDQWRPLKVASTSGLRLRAPTGYFP
jgi:VWFA-related protein